MVRIGHLQTLKFSIKDTFTGRMAALVYPRSSMGCDLMNLFFVIDEYTDIETASGCREMVDIMIDALENPHKPRPEGEVFLGEITRQ